MGFQCGLVGLPNVGKSTVFNSLTQASVPASNYPFCTVDPHVGTVAVPDPRLQVIANIVSPKTVIPAMMQFVDIAGLIEGAAQGEGLGNQFLSHIRNTQAIAHIVRCYDDKSIIHVTGHVDPIADIEIINTELALADLEVVEKALQKTEKLTRSGDKVALAKVAVLKRVQTQLAVGCPVRQMDLADEEAIHLKPYHLLTQKPVLYVANVSDTLGKETNPQLESVKALAEKEQAEMVVLCATLECEIASLDLAEQALFLNDLGLTEPGLNRLIRAGYRLLGLHTFFTAGPKELRAWTLKVGQTAQEAAAVIHTDFARRFIRAEVIGYNDYVKYGGEQGAKEAGVWRLEGKSYRVKDGDILYFRTDA